jgi:hypothetical protein
MMLRAEFPVHRIKTFFRADTAIDQAQQRLLSANATLAAASVPVPNSAICS